MPKWEYSIKCGFIMTDELKEELEDAAAATSKAYAHVRTLGTQGAAANAESDLLNLGQGNYLQLNILFFYPRLTINLSN